MAAVDDLRRLVALRKMPRVASHEIVGSRCLSTFEKSVIGFMGGDGQRLGWHYKVCNLADRGKRLLDLSCL